LGWTTNASGGKGGGLERLGGLAHTIEKTEEGLALGGFVVEVERGKSGREGAWFTASGGGRGGERGGTGMTCGGGGPGAGGAWSGG
jgi:hypothetical protein